MPDAVGPVGNLDAAAPARAQPRAPNGAPEPARPEFAQMLRSLMAEPRGRLVDVRAEIAALRDGGALRPRAATSSAPETAAYPRFAATGGPDPFGWRALARGLGDVVVAPGFGAIFERQIEQESGFEPDVAFGLRRSSAGAEGIAQLMPEYYPEVDRSDPHAALLAGAQTMRHYLAVFDGDVRKALASYNAGLGRVQSLVRAHGDGWERGLPAETRTYLDAIVGEGAYVVPPATSADAAVFGGRGPGGVLVPPLGEVLEERASAAGLELLGAAGALVRAPAERRVVELLGDAGAGSTLVLDHGNGWQSRLAGLSSVLVGAGEELRRGALLGTLAEPGTLGLAVLLDGRSLDPRRYLLGTAERRARG